MQIWLYLGDIGRLTKLNKITQAFNSGELSPLMDSRSDQAKYNAGCKTMENFIPLIYGGAQRRPGLEYIAAGKSSVEADKSRLVGFEHSIDDTYVLEFYNQGVRVLKDGARVYDTYGTQDLSDFDSGGDGSLVAQWKCNESSGAGAGAITDDSDAGTHDLTPSADISNFTTTDVEGNANEAFDLGGTYMATLASHGDFTFGDGSTDEPFSLMATIKHANTSSQIILQKWDSTNIEWKLSLLSNKVLFSIRDQSETVSPTVTTVDSLVAGEWYTIIATYDGRGGSSAANGMNIYINRTLSPVTRQNLAAYVAMEALAAPIEISHSTNPFDGTISNAAVFSKELSSSEISLLTGNTSTDIYSIVTPYLTADLFDLKFEQSADVMFITHPDYEPRKISRLADASWTIEELDLQTGPFRDQNTEISNTITATEISSGGIAVGASVTLTAVNHSPFLSSTTAGHVPSGTASTSKSLTGSLFKLVQGLSAGDQHISGLLAVGVADVSTATLSITKGTAWDLVTNGTWGTAADAATVDLERSYDSGTTYETVKSFTSAANYNISTSNTEDVDDAIYRLTVKDAGGASNMAFNLSVRGTGHVGIVEITAVTSGTVATATVLKTLASEDPTHRWSEGSFSNRRGWPIDVTISAEERLTFAGNVSEPLTVWGSVIGDFTDFALGNDDDSGIQFTLVGLGQQNRIRWMVAKDALILGTNGGEHLLGASKDEEALTPTNVKAKLQTTYGSENVASKIVNQAVIFIQRGGKKVREFLYNFEADAHKADDLTVFAEHITGAGIVDMAFQRTPDPILWCVRTDGELAILNYERDQNVFSWSRLFTSTNLAGASTKSVIESVAVIYGGTRSEDEVWVSILRQINENDSRTIERFTTRDLPSDDDDYKFLDSYITDTGGDVDIEGLSHLEGQTVQVYGDGLVQATKVVSSGAIEATTAADTYQVGLGYDSTIVPMDLDIEGTGLTTTKRINRASINLYETIGGEIGPDTSNLESIPTGTSLFTGHKEISIPGGYSRDTDITIRQTNPTPMTVLSVAYDLSASKD